MPEPNRPYRGKILFASGDWQELLPKGVEKVRGRLLVRYTATKYKTPASSGSLDARNRSVLAAASKACFSRELYNVPKTFPSAPTYVVNGWATRKQLLFKGLQIAILCFCSVYYSWR